MNMDIKKEGMLSKIDEEALKNVNWPYVKILHSCVKYHITLFFHHTVCKKWIDIFTRIWWIILIIQFQFFIFVNHISSFNFWNSIKFFWNIFRMHFCSKNFNLECFAIRYNASQQFDDVFKNNLILKMCQDILTILLCLV